MKASLPILALLLLTTGCARKAANFQCPLPESGAASGSLRETPQQVAKAGDQLGAGSENEIAGVIARLRRDHPTASQGEIVNYLITAYCPKLAANPALDRAQMQDKMQSFSGRVEQLSGKH